MTQNLPQPPEADWPRVDRADEAGETVDEGVAADEADGAPGPNTEPGEPAPAGSPGVSEADGRSEEPPTPGCPDRPEGDPRAWQLYPFSDDLSFWYPFSLAVAAAAPRPMAHLAAAIAVVLGVRMMAGLASIREPLAVDDVASARFVTVATAVLGLAAAIFRHWLPAMVFLLTPMFLFNALHNVKTMVCLGKKRRAEADRGGAPRA